MLPENTISIQQFINSSSSTIISYRSFSFLENMSNGTQVSIYDTISDYISEIRNLSYLVKLNTSEYRKYIYKPKLLCNDLYGNPEIYFIILLINDLADVKEFNKFVIYLPPKNIMSEIITQLYNTEKNAIQAYND